jgi:hypothetical protein
MLPSFITRLFIVLCLVSIVLSPAKAQLTLPPPPTEAALQKHTLDWIKTGNDFAQTSLDAPAIDREISSRIKAYDREKPIVTFDVPLNTRKLVKPTRKIYKQFSPTIGALNMAKNNGVLDREAYFWRYGNIDIAVPGDTYTDQYNVYSVARALEILQYRYPRAYQKLFVEPMQFSAAAPNYGTPKWKNRFATILISFDGSPVPIAAGQTAVASPVIENGIETYNNIAVVSLSNTNIRGEQESGSKPLYNAAPEENYVRYMREGLVETLVHEMLHRYIDYRNSYEEVYNTLFTTRDNLPGGKLFRGFQSLATTGEEAIVTTTSLHYFVREGGLQSNLLFFYRGTLDVSITRLMNSSLAESYATLVDPDVKRGALFKDRLRLPILD